ncbi:hypothetical protein V1225_01590 [Emergencia sp. JLR.KK010]|uniref:hypothetical protein n=1 Tax=Emergencia sp. JLR.KK010 TaxID=3114296 RepID=UPI0030CCD268
MKALDFNTLKKKYLTVTLPDENKTKLMLRTPTKRILNEFINLEKILEDGTDDDGLEEIYDTLAIIMSHNKTGRKVETETLIELMDMEDIVIFLQSYMDFVSEIVALKN